MQFTFVSYFYYLQLPSTNLLKKQSNIQIVQIFITPYSPASTPLHHSHSRTVHMGGDHLQQFMYMEYRMSTVSS